MADRRTFWSAHQPLLTIINWFGRLFHYRKTGGVGVGRRTEGQGPPSRHPQIFRRSMSRGADNWKKWRQSTTFWQPSAKSWGTMQFRLVESRFPPMSPSKNEVWLPPRPMPPPSCQLGSPQSRNDKGFLISL